MTFRQSYVSIPFDAQYVAMGTANKASCARSD